MQPFALSLRPPSLISESLDARYTSCKKAQKLEPRFFRPVAHTVGVSGKVEWKKDMAKVLYIILAFF